MLPRVGGLAKEKIQYSEGHYAEGKSRQETSLDEVMHESSVTKFQPEVSKSATGAMMNMIDNSSDVNLSTVRKEHARNVNNGDTSSEEPLISSPLQENNDDSQSLCSDETNDEISICEEFSDHPSEELMQHDNLIKVSYTENLICSMTSFLSKVINNTITTIIVFFMVAMRVEVIMIASCSLYDNNNTWHFNREFVFWIEFSLLLSFIVHSMAQIFKNTSRFTQEFVAVVFDLLLASLCIGILCWAEIVRCCDCNSSTNYDNILNNQSRLLGSTTEEYGLNCLSTIECCPRFGSRVCGGVGNIEPFTALIYLRIFRFNVGNVIYKCLSIERNIEMSESETLEEQRQSNHVQAKEVLHLNDTHKLIGLWQLALYQYPHVVDRHGMFSGELLQAMLGIYSDEQRHILNETMLSTSTLKQQNPSLDDHQDLKEEIHDAQLQISSRYANLDESVKEVILAGKVQKSVKRLNSQTPLLQSNTNVKKNAYSEFRYGLKSSFVVDTMKEEEVLDMFSNPDAPLVRSMRRCQYRFPPIIEKWTLVDLAITKYEIVIFSVDQDVENKWSEKDIRSREIIMHAIKSTHGGKGIRLRDIFLAKGREYRGVLTLSDINHIKVERVFPNTNVSKDNDRHKQIAYNELWEDSSKGTNCIPNYEQLESAWENAVEEKLRLILTEGTFFFRFLVDLAQELEQPIHTKVGGFAQKQGALLWCQTIAHLCCKSQLDQDLPNFGKSREEELKDFVVDSDRIQERNPKILLRMTSVGSFLSHKNKEDSAGCSEKNLDTMV